jgi:hypothetical protein
VRRQGNALVGAGRVVDAAGNVLAMARGRFVALGERQLSRFVGPDE